MEYVKDRIANEAPKITRGKSLSPGLLPHPSDRRWNIDDFDTWLATSGNYDALDPLDNKPAFAHDLNDHKEGPGKKPKHTPLDLEYKRRLVEAKDMLMTHVGADLNIIELEKYLNNRSNDEDEIGLFDKYRSPSTGKVTSKIWEDTDSIAATAGTRRSVQIRLLNQKVNEFLDFVFNAKDPNSGNLRFFINKPGVWERIKKYYYKIKYKLDL